MGQTFSLVTLLDVLIRLEERGAEFYRTFAETTSSKEVRDLFLTLGKEEVKHDKLYREMKGNLLSGPLPEEDPDRQKELDLLLSQSFSFEEFRPTKKDPQKALREAFDFAIGLEKETIEYTRTARGLLRTEDAEVFKAIIQEEENHLNTLKDHQAQMCL